MTIGQKYILIIIITAVLVGVGVKVSDEMRLKTKIAPLQAQIESLQNELKTKEKEINLANEKLERIKNRIGVLHGIFLPIMESEEMTDIEAVNWLLGWSDKIKATEDNLLITKFQTFLETQTDKAFADFFLYSFESISNILEE